MLSLGQAVERLLAGVTPITGDEVVPLQQALGRVLAGEVAAPLDLPSFTNSAMDGYALRADDALPGARLRVMGASHWPVGHSPKPWALVSVRGFLRALLCPRAPTRWSCRSRPSARAMRWC